MKIRQTIGIDYERKSIYGYKYMVTLVTKVLTMVQHIQGNKIVNSFSNFKILHFMDLHALDCFGLKCDIYWGTFKNYNESGM